MMLSPVFKIAGLSRPSGSAAYRLHWGDISVGCCFHPIVPDYYKLSLAADALVL